MLGPIEVVECTGHGVSSHELRLLDQGLEQPTAYDLKSFLRACRRPRRLQPPDHVAQARQRRAPTLAANLDVVSHRVRRAGRVRGGEANDDQALLRGLRSFSKRLREGKMSLEAAPGQVALIVQLAGVRDPLINEN